MIQNFDDFCRELNNCGFSMGGGNAKGIFALIDYDWLNTSRVSRWRSLRIFLKSWVPWSKQEDIAGMI